MAYQNRPAWRLFVLIRQLGGRLFSQILERRRPDAFQGAQGRTLCVLWQGDGVTLTELAGLTGLAQTTLSGIVERMETSGLLERRADSYDRRKTRLFLTEHAQALRGDYEDAVREMRAAFYRGFSESEIRQFEGYLERIAVNLERT